MHPSDWLKAVRCIVIKKQQPLSKNDNHRDGMGSVMTCAVFMT